jgi:hypothetical protein
MGRHPGDVDLPRVDLNEEEDVGSPEKNSFHGEEVVRQEGCCCGVDELAPGQTRSPRRWLEAVALQKWPRRSMEQVEYPCRPARWWIRRYPQDGFSLARPATSRMCQRGPRVALANGDRSSIQRLRTKSPCHRSNVSGWTKNRRRRDRDSRRLSPVSRARSTGSSAGHGTSDFRRRTATSWRSITTSICQIGVSRRYRRSSSRNRTKDR